MSQSFEIRDVPAKPAIFIAATCRRDDIGSTLMELLPENHRALHRLGARQDGPPFCRYVSHTGEEIDVEAGLPVSERVATGDLRVLSGTIGGCRAAFTVHRGPYSTLGDTYAALEDWIVDQGHVPGDGRWASYVTDPSDEPDPENWVTEIYWPV